MIFIDFFQELWFRKLVLFQIFKTWYIILVIRYVKYLLDVLLKMFWFRPTPERLILEAMRSSISSTPENLDSVFALLADNFHLTISSPWDNEVVTLASKEAVQNCMTSLRSHLHNESDASSDAVCDPAFVRFFLRMHNLLVEHTPMDLSRMSHSVIYSDNTTFIDECTLGDLIALKTFEFEDDKLVSETVLLGVSSDIWYVRSNFGIIALYSPFCI